VKSAHSRLGRQAGGRTWIGHFKSPRAVGFVLDHLAVAGDQRAESGCPFALNDIAERPTRPPGTEPRASASGFLPAFNLFISYVQCLHQTFRVPDRMNVS